MRIPRERIFKITKNGLDVWTEPAGDRSPIEYQHYLATQKYPGAFIRLEEQYKGGAKAPLLPEEEEE